MDRDEQENLEAILGEFLPDDDEVERQIEAEWKRMHAAGEEIRVGDPPALLFYQWAESHGISFFDALRRRFGLHYNDEEDA